MLLVDVRVSALFSLIANASTPILVCLRIFATPSPIARARAEESRQLTPAFRSTYTTCALLLVPVRVSVALSTLARVFATELRLQISTARSPKATRNPLLVPVRVNVYPAFLARALGTEPRLHVPAVRAAQFPTVLRAGPPVAPVPRAAPFPPAVQAPQPLVPEAHSTQAPQVPFVIDLRVASPPSFVRVEIYLCCMHALCHRLCWSLRASNSTWFRSARSPASQWAL